MPPIRPIGIAAIKAPVTEWMNSNGTICGTAITVPHTNSVLSA